MIFWTAIFFFFSFLLLRKNSTDDHAGLQSAPTSTTLLFRSTMSLWGEGDVFGNDCLTRIYGTSCLHWKRGKSFVRFLFEFSFIFLLKFFSSDTPQHLFLPDPKTRSGLRRLGMPRCPQTEEIDFLFFRFLYLMTTRTTYYCSDAVMTACTRGT